jgi:hypothetical protein
MGNNFDKMFAEAAALDGAGQITAWVVLTTMDQTNTVKYASGQLTYIPGSVDFFHPAPAKFSTGVGVLDQTTQLLNTDQGSDGGPFDPNRSSPMNILITAPFRILEAGAPVSPYSVSLQFDAGGKNQISVAFVPSFDPTSGIAYGPVNLTTPTLVVLSLANVQVQPPPPK